MIIVRDVFQAKYPVVADEGKLKSLAAWEKLGIRSFPIRTSANGSSAWCRSSNPGDASFTTSSENRGSSSPGCCLHHSADRSTTMKADSKTETEVKAVLDQTGRVVCDTRHEPFVGVVRA